MSSEALTYPIEPAKAASPGDNYLTNGFSLKSWLLTHDHKRIAILYLISISVFFVIGGLAASLVRLELITPEGDLLAHETYNKMFTTPWTVNILLYVS